MQRSTTFLLYGLLSLCYPCLLQAQTTLGSDSIAENLSEWSVGGYSGYLLAHHPDLQFLSDGHSIGGGVSWAHRTNGSKDWHHFFNFPAWGVELDGYGLGSDYLGGAGAVRIFWDIPLNASKSIHWKMGIGPGYISKPFDPDENLQNSAIGSHINTAFALECYFRVKLSQKVELKPGLALHHYSNGALQMPNSGLNYLMLHTVVAFAPKGFIDPTRLSPPFPKGEQHWRLGISAGMKQGDEIQSPYYGVVNGFGIWDIRVSPKSLLGAEVGLNYNATLSTRVEGQDDPSFNYRAYVAGLYQLCFGDLGIRFSAGAYIAPKFTEDGAVFLRYHILYNFNRIQIFAGLKSHYAKADNIEIGTAIRIK